MCDRKQIGDSMGDSINGSASFVLSLSSRGSMTGKKKKSREAASR